MKRTLLAAILVILSLSVLAQNNTFKTITKKQGGNTSLSARYPSINGNTSKSGHEKKYNLSGNIRFPVIKGNTSDIKKMIIKNNSPVYIEKNVSGNKSFASLSYEDRFYGFFEEIILKTKITEPRESFSISDIRTDELGITHINAIQTYKGIKIYGSETSLHLSPGIERFTGRFYPFKGEISTKPKNSTEEVLALVVRDIRKITRYREMRDTEKEILKYESPSCNLIILNLKDNLYYPCLGG